MPPTIEMIAPNCEKLKAIASPAFDAAKSIKIFPMPQSNPTTLFLITYWSMEILNDMKVIAPKTIPTAMGKMTDKTSNFMMLLNNTAYIT